MIDKLEGRAFDLEELEISTLLLGQVVEARQALSGLFDQLGSEHDFMRRFDGPGVRESAALLESIASNLEGALVRESDWGEVQQKHPDDPQRSSDAARGEADLRNTAGELESGDGPVEARTKIKEGVRRSLSQDEREWMPATALDGFGLSSKTVYADSRKNMKAGEDYRGGGGAMPIEYRRASLIVFVQERWAPRLRARRS